MNFEKKYDVVVVGGGMAGVAAALEAARSGAQVALLEKTVMPGGLATIGLIDIYLPLCDGQGRQLAFGIAEELLRESIKYGPGRIPPQWDDKTAKEEQGRYRVRFSAASFVLALDEVMVRDRVHIWYDTLACLPVVEKGAVVGVEVENKSGRGLLRAGCVVDASGDADMAYRAGAACHEGRNYLSMWALGVSDKAARDFIENPVGVRGDHALRLGGDAMGRNNPPDAREYVGMDGRQVTDFALHGRRLLREHYNRLQIERGEVGRTTLYPTTLPSMAQFRTTRAVVGCATLDDNGDFRRHEDSIGMIGDWRKAGPAWEIPYGALVPEKLDGLLTAGRCISSINDAWAVTRVIPTAALTGQAAGAAAALALRAGCTPRDLGAARVQAHLRGRGVKLHLDEVGLSYR